MFHDNFNIIGQTTSFYFSNYWNISLWKRIPKICVNIYFNNNIYSNFLSNNIIENAKTISIKFLNNVDSFDKKEWEELYRLSEDTFVEESDSLKETAAGAGLTDND